MRNPPRALSALLLMAAMANGPVAIGQASPSPPSEKDTRTRTQQKIDSQLLYALYLKRGEAKRRGTPTETAVKTDARGRVLIDVRAEVTPDLLARIEKLGGAVVSKSKEHRSTLAKFPLEKLEDLARFKDVLFIEPAAEAITQ